MQLYGKPYYLKITTKVTDKYLCLPLSQLQNYCKNPKNSDTQKIAVIILKLEQNGFTTDELAQKM